VVAGDFAGYWAGRLGGPVLLARASRWLKVRRGGTSTWRASLDRWGGLTVFLTRFLLSPLGPAVNIIAGVEQYRFRSFVFYDVAGEVLWVALYAGLGYALGTAAVALAGMLGDVSAALAILVLVAGLLAYLLHEIAERHHRRLLNIPADSTSASIEANDLEVSSPR
jgi:membrane protein DedA with SNARE-associated domain